jgi:hypothetical protein
MGYSFFRGAVHMWQRAKSNEQAFKIFMMTECFVFNCVLSARTQGNRTILLLWEKKKGFAFEQLQKVRN